jgi:hypothetical protein
MTDERRQLPGDTAESSLRDVLVLCLAGLWAELSFEGAIPELAFVGAVPCSAPEAVIGPFLKSVHERLCALGCAQVSVNFGGLEYLSPSGLEVFVHWLDALRATPDESRYHLLLRGSPRRPWQRTSLLVLQSYGPDVADVVE